MKINYVMIFVSDMSKSVAFYRDVVGMPLKYETPEWSEFITEGTNLALHKALATAGNRDRLEAGQCRPGFQVADLNGFHNRMTNNNVECVEQPKESFGVMIAQYKDPDGLEFSVSQEIKQS